MDWVDIVKGVTIILMIIGHTISSSSKMYMFIYSFHMPLFIILSGITYRSSKNIKEVLFHIKKYFKRLFVPYSITLLVCSSIHTVLDQDILSFPIFIRNIFYDFIWGNGCSYLFLGKEFSGVGEIWFLITLFLSKILFDFINLVVRAEYKRGIIYSFLMIIMITFSVFWWLPWGLDLVFVFIFYLYIGHLLSIYKDFFKKHFKLCFVVAFLFWMVCLFGDMYVELAVRRYPLGFVSILESVCGAYCVIMLFQFLENKSIIKKVFVPIGKLSLLILCVHSIEKFFIDWNIFYMNNIFLVMFRVCFDVGLAAFLEFSKKSVISKVKRSELKIRKLYLCRHV